MSGVWGRSKEVFLILRWMYSEQIQIPENKPMGVMEYSGRHAAAATSSALASFLTSVSSSLFQKECSFVLLDSSSNQEVQLAGV